MRKSYAEKLKDPRWQKARLAVLERANWKCENCQTDAVELHVHHLAYLKKKEPWEYPLDYLMALCRACHEQRQEIEDKLRLVLILSLRKVPNSRLLKVCEFWMGKALEEAL